MLLGSPGSGKGTLAVQLSQALNILHISTGDIFRAAIKEKTPLGLEVQSIIESGDLVSDRLTASLVMENLNQDKAQKGFILDGFPRNITQAEIFSKMITLDLVIYLKIERKINIKRLTGRLTCGNCGKGYHRDFSPPQVEGKCDACQNDLIQREDDQLSVVENRLRTYTEQTQPLVDYYTEKGILKTIDASPSPKEVFDYTMKTLNK